MLKTIDAQCDGNVVNLNFMFAGSTSTNPQLVLLAGMIVFAGGVYAGYLGVDYYFRPVYRNFMATWLGRRRTGGTTV